MNSSDLATLVPWIIAHGYLIFFLIVVIEGPLTTIAAGVAASLGYFNIYLIMLISLTGEVSGDFIFFSIGYLVHSFIRLSFFRRIGLSEARLEKIEKLIHKNITKAVLVIKMSPLIGSLGILTIGTTRPKFKKFFFPALYLAIPKSFFFALLGYFSGQTYLHLNKIILHSQEIIFGIAGVLILIYVIYLKVVARIAKKIEIN